MSVPHTDRADDLREREADAARRAPVEPLADLGHLFTTPRTPPTPTVCKHCGQPTPDMAARMAHDELHARRHGDTF